MRMACFWAVRSRIQNSVSDALLSWPSVALSSDGTGRLPVAGQLHSDRQLLMLGPSYYVLIATCVFARKKEWIRNACLAAALLLPAVAALHGIVLAAFHREGELATERTGRSPNSLADISLSLQEL